MLDVVLYPTYGAGKCTSINVCLLKGFMDLFTNGLEASM
jgi:hypothetical protein